MVEHRSPKPAVGGSIPSGRASGSKGFKVAKKEKVLIKYYKGIKNYLLEVVVELKKVLWPSREQVITSTQIVLVFTAFFGLYVGLWDNALAYLLSMIFKGVQR